MKIIKIINQFEQRFTFKVKDNFPEHVLVSNSFIDYSLGIITSVTVTARNISEPLEEFFELSDYSIKNSIQRSYSFIGFQHYIREQIMDNL